MKTYPIMLNVQGRLAVVVGAGAVGLRKVRSLADAGATVRLVAPQAHDGDAEGATVVAEPYRGEHLTGASLVFACTDDRELNARIAADARGIGALVNAADQPEDCDFYLPAVVADGDVLVAVGTGGACPALAAELKHRLADALPDRVGEFAAALAEARRQIQNELDDDKQRGRIMRELAGAEGLQAFAEGGRYAIQQMLARLLAGTEQ